jgi:hypothetical protein
VTLPHFSQLIGLHIISFPSSGQTNPLALVLPRDPGTAVTLGFRALLG